MFSNWFQSVHNTPNTCVCVCVLLKRIKFINDPQNAVLVKIYDTQIVIVQNTKKNRRGRYVEILLIVVTQKGKIKPGFRSNIIKSIDFQRRTNQRERNSASHPAFLCLTSYLKKKNQIERQYIMFLYPYGGTWNNVLSADALEQINVPYHPTCRPPQFEYNDRSSITSIVRVENKQAHLNREKTSTHTGHRPVTVVFVSTKRKRTRIKLQDLYF